MALLRKSSAFKTSKSQTLRKDAANDSWEKAKIPNFSDYLRSAAPRKRLTARQ